jgi:hypothetical protein
MPSTIDCGWKNWKNKYNYFKELTLFDHVVAFDPIGVHCGNFTRRFVLDIFSPYVHSMHVDADCFLLSRNVDEIWGKLKGRDVGVMGYLVNSGVHHNGTVDVTALVSAGVCKNFVLTNWGVFYFHAEPGNKVMQEATRLLNLQINGELSHPVTYFSKPGQYSDEPLWGIAMANVGIDPLEFDYSNLLQATSPNSSEHVFDFLKPSMNLKKGGVNNVSGYFFHFCGIEPLDHYLKGVLFFREQVGIEPPLIYVDSELIDTNSWSNLSINKKNKLNWKFKRN